MSFKQKRNFFEQRNAIKSEPPPRKGHPKVIPLPKSEEVDNYRYYKILGIQRMSVLVGVWKKTGYQTIVHIFQCILLKQTLMLGNPKFRKKGCSSPPPFLNVQIMIHEIDLIYFVRSHQSNAVGYKWYHRSFRTLYGLVWSTLPNWEYIRVRVAYCSRVNRDEYPKQYLNDVPPTNVKVMIAISFLSSREQFLKHRRRMMTKSQKKS